LPEASVRSLYVTVTMSPCNTHPVKDWAVNAVGHPWDGPSVNVIVWSYSNTPEFGDTSTNAVVLFPGVEIIASLEPLSTLITTLLSSVDV